MWPPARPERSRLPPPERSSALSEHLLHLLRTGTLTVEGRLVDASNATLYCTVVGEDAHTVCVYKPIRGERPLWDFPEGTLAGREVATYLVSEATGWGLVPPTVLREGPFGPGMCQLWIEMVDGVDLRELAASDHLDLQRMVLLDAVVNNADRKGGHLLPTRDGRVLGVDHGVCFSSSDKLRTLLWQWAGQPLSQEARDVLAHLHTELQGALGTALHTHVDRTEVRATLQRVERLLAGGIYPYPSEDWPAIPWPPF